MFQTITTDFFDRFAISLFNLIAALRNFRFLQVASMREEADFASVQEKYGFDFPDEIEAQLQAYKNGGVRFIAYHGNKPVGIVRLADPNIVNRPFDLYGVDAECRHHEIQHLTVAAEYREGSQFVMLGLFKMLYRYSRRNGIPSWISCSTRNVYRTMRRYSRDIELLDVDFDHFDHPVTRYLYRRQVFDTCYVMRVEGFSPRRIFIRFLKYRFNSLTGLLLGPLYHKAL